MPDVSYYSVCQRTYPAVTLLIDAAVAIKCYGVAVSYLIVIGDLMPEVATSLFSLPHNGWMVRINLSCSLNALPSVTVASLSSLDST